MINILLAILQSTFFWVNTIIGIILIEYALHKCRAVIKVDEERDSKYSAFRRYDVKHWKRWRLYLAAPFLPARCILAILHLFVLYIFIRVINFNMTETNPPSEFQKWLTVEISKLIKRSQLLCAGGMIWITKKYLDVDYKKYLGPDWTPTTRGPSTIVSNHSCWMDILVGCYSYNFPVFTSKVGIKNWTFIGTLVTYPGYEALFLDRAGTKEDREKLVHDINKMQKERQEQQRKPLIMYPEGCTTNNTELLQFRRGAFFGLHSVQPVTLKYYSPYFQPTHDILDVFSQILLTMCQPYTTAVTQVLPVFEPNEYFYKHHSQPGEEKWQTYMRVIRQLMADALGFKLSEQKLEDKFDYKVALYPKKGSKNKSE